MVDSALMEAINGAAQDLVEFIEQVARSSEGRSGMAQAMAAAQLQTLATIVGG